MPVFFFKVIPPWLILPMLPKLGCHHLAAAAGGAAAGAAATAPGSAAGVLNLGATI